MQTKFTNPLTQPLLSLATLSVVPLSLGLQAGITLAQTPPPIFQETFLNGSLTNTTGNPYTVGGTSDAGGSSVCLTASQIQTQQPIPGCAPNSAGIPATGDATGTGALRLTSNRQFTSAPRSINDPGEEGFFIINQSLSTGQGLIFEFEFFTYNGQSFGNLPGGDGFSFFLIRDEVGGNAAAPAQAGAFGGSLGYAQKNATAERGAVAGLPNAYVGIGFDDFGNFSNGDEGRVGGNASGVLTPNRVVLRGGADIAYGFLQSFTPPGQLSDPGAATRGVGRRGRITISPTNQLSVELSFTGAPTGFVPIVQNFDLTSIPGQRGLPPFFKFGFAASTGTSTAIHEIRNLTVRPITNPPPPPVPPPPPPAPVPPPPPPIPPPPPPPPPPVQIFRLVKRVSAITRSGLRTEFNTFVDDPNDPNDNVPGWNQLAGGLSGLTRGGDRIQTGDEVEYTIYYLAEGDTTLVGSTICDQIPDGSSFIPNSNLISPTNQALNPGGRVFNKLQPIEPGDNACADQRNPNGTVLFDLGNLPVTPGNNFGFVRFRTKVN